MMSDKFEILLIMIPDQYPNYYIELEIYTGYFDSLDIMILFFFNPSSIVITRDYCRTITAQWEGMGDGGCRVGEVRARTTSPMPDRKSFKLQQLPEIPPLHLYVNFQTFSTLRVNLKSMEFDRIPTQGRNLGRNHSQQVS